MANQGWLLSEEDRNNYIHNITEEFGDSGRINILDVDVDGLLKAQLARCEPLIREEERKKFEGWKSPKEVEQIRKDAYQLGVDHQNDLNKLDCETERTKTLKEVGEWLNKKTAWNPAHILLELDIKSLNRGVMPKE